MTSALPEERVGLPVLTMRAWARQTFVHWPCDPDRLEALLPAGLEPHLYEGAAWVSFTPFVMERVRAAGSLGLPGPSTFPESNLRTYVRGPDGRDGLWFLSIDVPQPALAAAARGGAGVPYHLASMLVEQQADGLRYAGSRRGGGPSYRLRVRPGVPLRPSERDVWLTSRWRAYSRRLGVLWETPVWHEPWPLRSAVVEELEEDVMAAAGLPPSTALPPPLVHFSGGARRVRMGVPRPARCRRRTAAAAATG
jgi:uncharacterized protein